MRLPIAVDIEWSKRDDLRNPRFWLGIALALAGLIVGTFLVRITLLRPVEPPVSSASVAITSAPTGATILIAGRERGRTPATLALPPGEQRIILRFSGRADTTYDVRLEAGQQATLSGILWLRAPQVLQLRSPLPGATIVGAQFLGDGRVALALALPSGDERQLWLLDRDGGTRRIGPPLARVAIVVAPDGARVAYLARPATGLSGAASGLGTAGLATEVWLAGTGGDLGERRYALPPNTAAERFVDLSWSPDGKGLLLASEQHPQGGGVRTRLLWLALATGPATSAPRELITLPSEIVPGAYTWDPRGERVGLLARAGGKTSLCLLTVADGAVRSLADVATDGRAPAPFPPLTWRDENTGDGAAAMYAAPSSGASAGGVSFGTAPMPRLYADGPGPDLGAAEGLGPGWRGDGLLLTLARRGRGSQYILRAFDPLAAGAAQDLGTLPSSIGAPEGVRWDMARGQALVAVRDPGGGGQFDLWLVRWAGSEGETYR